MNAQRPTLPGGPIPRKPLHVIFILDVSGSMGFEGKIQALNNAIRETLPAVVAAAAGNIQAQVLLRVVTFSDGARWHIATPTPPDAFTWSDVNASGDTDMGAALRLVTEALRSPPMPARSLPPVLVLITDGQPTDDFAGGLAALTAEFWGQRAVRVGIAIGRAADRRCLEQFIGDPNRRVLDAYNAVELARQLEGGSMLAIGRATGDRPLPARGPAPPAQDPPGDDRFVWK